MELKLPEQIDVIDITMRDGLQNEEHYVPLEAKLYLADRLIKAGFKRLEVGSISHVAYVPQFKDVDELLLKLPKDVDVEYTVLALTPKAIERVGGLLDRGAKIDRVLTGQIATSEAYAMKNMRRTHQQHPAGTGADGKLGLLRLVKHHGKRFPHYHTSSHYRYAFSFHINSIMIKHFYYRLCGTWRIPCFISGKYFRYIDRTHTIHILFRIDHPFYCFLIKMFWQWSE